VGEAIGKIRDINAEPCLMGEDSRYDPSALRKAMSAINDNYLNV
jgi:hypothetical protein